jgi:signal transduction histidine kinase
MEDSWDWVQEELRKLQDDIPADPEMMQVVDAISVADFWKRRYDEERLLWERKLESREDEKHALQDRAQEHAMSIKELDFKLKELERRWQQEKLLLEDRLATKEAETATIRAESQLEKRLHAVELENENLKDQLSRAAGVPFRPSAVPQQPSAGVTMPVMPAADAASSAEYRDLANRLAAREADLKKSEEDIRRRMEEIEAQRTQVARDLSEKEKNFLTEKQQWQAAEHEVKSLSTQMVQKLSNLKEREEEHFVILEDLARGFAHRVRNHLGIMSGTIQLALANFKMEAELAEQLQVVDQSVQDMLKSIEDFLSLARIPELSLQPLNSVQALESALAPLDAKCRTQNITIMKKFDPAAPLFPADQKLLGEGLQHLLENAVEAMSQGGTLTLSTAYDAERATLAVVIADTGIGISEAHIKKVFQPYFSSKKNRKGLGLTIAKRVIDLHRGTLTLASTKGQGTTVTIHFFPEKAG